MAANNWDLAFRRALSPEELEDWQSLSALFPVLSESADSVVWPHSASGRFTAKSLYSRLIGGTPSTRFSCVWKSKVPPKIKIFLWQAFLGRLPAADQIKKRNGPGSEFCHLCGALENSDHIFSIACWLSWFGVVSDLGYRFLGTLPHSPIFET